MSSLDRSPSLESIASLRSSPEADKAKLNPTPIDPTCTISLVQTPTTSERCPSEGAAIEPEKPAYSEHARFFLPAENIFFVVANTLYSVHRSPFEKHSSAFAGKGLTKENPMVLEGVTAAHLDNFLSILYPSEYGAYAATSVEECTSILHLAIRWGFKSIKNLSIERLSPIASDIDKIVLGRQYTIDKWLGDAYLAICSRQKCLSKEEGRRMQVDDIIEISAIRHQFGLGALSKVVLPLSIGEVRVRFGLVASHTAVVPPKPKKPVKKASSTEKSRDAAALELAEWVKDREMTERALRAFADDSQNPLYAKADQIERSRLSSTVSALKKQLASTKQNLEERARKMDEKDRKHKSEMDEEDRKQKVDDFIANYKAANSEL